MALICPWDWMIVLMNSMVVGVEGGRKLFQVVGAEEELLLQWVMMLGQVVEVVRQA